MNFETLYQNLMKSAGNLPVVEKIEEVTTKVLSDKEFAGKLKVGLTEMRTIIDSMISLVP